MLSQNFKGLLTLVLIFALLIGGFYAYKNIFEPSLITKENVEQFPVSTDVEITPKIEIFDTKVNIIFQTPFQTKTAVLYCVKQDTKNCKEIPGNENSKDQNITIANLTPATEYEYKLMIEDKYYPAEEKSYFNFKTKLANTSSSSPTPTKSPLLSREGNKLSPTSSSKKTSLVEFREAMKKQDLKYDTDNDGKVTIEDYKP